MSQVSESDGSSPDTGDGSQYGDLNAVEGAPPPEAETDIEQAVENWLVEYIAEVLDMDSKGIDKEASLDEYGIDSATAVGLTGDLTDWLKVRVDPTVVYEHTTIKALTRHLVEVRNAQSP